MNQPVKASSGGDMDRSDLWTLYKSALDDRNFQVQLNWDRTKHYFIFNVGVFTIAAGLVHVDASRLAQVAVFLLAALNSFIAAYAIWKGHTYYRAARKHFDEIQRELGLTEMDRPFAMKTTKGMVRDIEGAAKIPLRDRITITNLNVALQLYIGIAACVALARLWCWF
jgi:hypothetical protein